MGLYLGSTQVAPVISSGKTTGEYEWMGENVTKTHDKFYTNSVTLADTAYNGWTPSTTAKSIIASATATAFTADVANYEYMLEWLWDYEIVYNSDYTKKAATERQYGVLYQIVHRRPYGLANFEAENYAYNYCTTFFSSSSYCIYYNTSGTRTWTSGISYGFYASAQTITLSSTSANSITVTPKTPAMYARCSSTYLSTESAAEIDQDNSTVKIVGNIYKMDIDSCAVRHMYGNAIKMYNTPL